MSTNGNAQQLKEDRLWGIERDPTQAFYGALVVPPIYLWDQPTEADAARERRRVVAPLPHNTPIYIREEVTTRPKDKDARPRRWYHVVDMTRGVSGWVLRQYLKDAGEPEAEGGKDD